MDACCANAKLLESGFDFDTFAVGNSCAGDTDDDYVLGSLECSFAAQVSEGETHDYV